MQPKQRPNDVLAAVVGVLCSLLEESQSLTDREALTERRLFCLSVRERLVVLALPVIGTSGTTVDSLISEHRRHTPITGSVTTNCAVSYLRCILPPRATPKSVPRCRQRHSFSADWSILRHLAGV